MSEQLNIQGSSGRCISSGTARGSDISTTANLHDKWPNNAGAHVDVSGTHTMRYSILETPPWPETMLLGLQVRPKCQQRVAGYPDTYALHNQPNVCQFLLNNPFHTHHNPPS
jgi:hypothetical protein